MRKARVLVNRQSRYAIVESSDQPDDYERHLSVVRREYPNEWPAYESMLRGNSFHDTCQEFGMTEKELVAARTACREALSRSLLGEAVSQSGKDKQRELARAFEHHYRNHSIPERRVPAQVRKRRKNGPPTEEEEAAQRQVLSNLLSRQ
jgi:hypothetical protein